MTSGEPAAVDVADWFTRRTHRGGFDIAELVRRRRADGTTVSVVVPTRDEATTVTAVVRTLVALSPDLIDEVVVVDAGSPDGTAELAARAGARVHHDAALPPGGPVFGKGDALWRSLGVTSGDVVAFVDADLRGIGPGYVADLLGPLLTDPGIAFVKGCFDRPISLDGVRHEHGGGRVTELTARPLLNLFWPELAGFAQPLAGEYAARRELLVELPFFTGYGVELGLLVDAWSRVGIDALAQVDLGRREHRNQDLAALSRMAYGIMQVASHRLETSGRARFAEAIDPRYRQILRGEGGDLELTTGRVEIVERPPWSGHTEYVGHTGPPADGGS